MFEKNNLVKIVPVAENMYQSLRNSGYDNVQAVEDLVDNSIDADARNIWVTVDNLDKVIIADDGVGMSYDDLIRALELGGKKEHDEGKDLGKYGFGLITASISLSPRFKIITKKDDKTYTAVFDCGVIERMKEHVAKIYESDELEKRSFSERTDNADSGTVLIIENCDRIKYDSVDSLKKALKTSLKRVYRVFLREEGNKIFFNGVLLQIDDPLMLSSPQTKVRLDKIVDIELTNGDIEKMRIIAVTVPIEIGRVSDKSTKIATQGFYALRNNREIAAAVEIPEVFKKHNYYNLFRIELQFNSGLDDEMNVNFSKHDINPTSRVVNILKRELSSIAKEVYSEAQKRGKKNTEKRKKGENPWQFVGGGNVGGDGVVDSGKATKIDKPKFEGVKIGMRFKTESDALFEVSATEENASVMYNGANAFYRDRIINSDEGANLKRYLDLMIKSAIEVFIANGVSTDLVEKLGKDVAKRLEENIEQYD